MSTVHERRQTMRVDSALLFHHRQLTEEEHGAMIPDIMNKPSDYLIDDEDFDLATNGGDDWQRVEAVLSNFYQMMREMRDEIQKLSALQRGETIEEEISESERALNISGDGVAYLSKEPVSAGTKMALTFDLTRFPHRTVACLGEVVTSEPGDEEHAGDQIIRVRYTHIRELDRDRIINYVFKLQRRQIRSQRAQADH